MTTEITFASDKDMFQLAHLLGDGMGKCRNYPQ